jgi:hypothetical protein
MIANAQPEIKANIEEIKAKFNGFASSLASIKNNTDALGEMMKNVKSKAEIFSPDLFSGEAFERLKDGIKVFKEKMDAEGGGMKKFMGSDLKGGPGTECFKFKKDIQEVFTGIENLRKTLLGTEGNNLSIANKLSELMDQSPGFGLYPVYVTVGPMVSMLSKNLADVSNNLQTVMAHAKAVSSQPGGLLKVKGIKYYDYDAYQEYISTPSPALSDLYIEGLKPTIEFNNSAASIYPTTENNSIDTNITTIQLSDLCSVDRVARGTAINLIRSGLKVLQLCAKLLENDKDKEMEVGASFVGHITTAIKINPCKTIGVIIEGLCDIIDQYVEAAGNNLDKCENLRAQKVIADNQETIMKNQKLIFELLARENHSNGH